ncbi:unnamed protein product [Meloidogyne enterolobii]|uniref:Uncharacterized protein n=1 Tax=Meloidogyne enterolobii TaxID=390850 RepID=A0ACB1ARA7_MELEN
MKLESVLIFVIFNAILWSLINSVKNNKVQNELNRVGEVSKNVNKNSTNEAESSVDPQIQEHNETTKNSQEDTVENNERKSDRKKYFKIYRQNNREKIIAYNRDYKNKNRERIRENAKNIHKKNRENAIFVEKRKEYYRNYNKNYYQNNKKRIRQNKQKYRQKMKNEKEIEESSKLRNLESDNNEGTSFVNPQIDDFRDKGKEPIVFEESFDTEERTLFNQGEEELEEIEAETNLHDLNEIVVEEPNNIQENYLDQINLNKNIYRFDLNEKPKDGQEDD